MFIALLDFHIPAAQRQAALAHLQAEGVTVRAMPGNLAFLPLTDPADDTKIVLLHEWQGDAEFQAYQASDSFARLGQSLRPLMTAAPRSRRFDAMLVEERR